MLPGFTSGGSDHGAVRVRAVPPGRLAAAEADVSRMRLVVEGSRDFGLDSGGTVTHHMPHT